MEKKENSGVWQIPAVISYDPRELILSDFQF